MKNEELPRDWSDQELTRYARVRRAFVLVFTQALV
jgi:hypothetical protein